MTVLDSLFDSLKPIPKRSNPEARIKGAKKTKDQEVLIQLLRNDADSSVRSAAFRRLEDLDKGWIRELQGTDSDVGWINELTLKPLLIRLLCSCPIDPMGSAAGNRLDSLDPQWLQTLRKEKTLLDIAEEAPDAQSRAALERLNVIKPNWMDDIFSSADLLGALRIKAAGRIAARHKIIEHVPLLAKRLRDPKYLTMTWDSPAIRLAREAFESRNDVLASMTMVQLVREVCLALEAIGSTLAAIGDSKGVDAVQELLKKPDNQILNEIWSGFLRQNTEGMEWRDRPLLEKVEGLKKRLREALNEANEE